MRIDMTNPASIADWYRQHPRRHGPQLAAMAKLWPAFADAIRAAGELLRKT